jgi:glycosyltransferase involved in cell wall biosynthesis
MLCVVETHLVQYHAPVYRKVQEKFGVPVSVIYGSDFSINGYRDREFGKVFAWDKDLLSGYESHFLSRVEGGGARNDGEVSTRGLRAALRRLNPKALLLVGYSPRFHQCALYEAWRFGRPILFRGETTDSAQRRGRIKTWTRDFLLRRLYGRCAKLLFVGQHSRQHFERLGCLPDKLVFSPYCVNTFSFRCAEEERSELRATTRRELGIADTDMVILFSGKISFRKGPDLLLAAAKKTPANLRQRVVLLFLGDGELRGHLDEEAKREPQVRARFVGFKNQAELSPFYHGADLLVLPSRFGETWGLVVNEALHHGVPCVVSEAVGCAPDLIVTGSNGEICESGSVESLSMAIQRAIPLVGRRATRDACRHTVAGYSVEQAAAGIAQACRAAVDHVPLG